MMTATEVQEAIAMEPAPATVEEIVAAVDSFPMEEKIWLVNKIRNNWGLPARTLEEFRQQGGAFTKEEEEAINRLVVPAG